ncbi:hypothetical protein PGTUg99_001892 [Puccinia graminis f. sp. tritici]|uniref:Uncharacterized protein n=1 Tax=Puccinia graminis f. sp. tritici TaxID=56615 RepID=A0A5B0P6F4_PUCGR|nr:hypothetical protein PGTUg99_001892 [Puccinia graminis f. sp. tritici]
MRVIQQANVDNFDALLANPSAITKDPNLLTMTRKRNKTTPKGTLSYPLAVAQDLVHHLVHSFEVFYGELLGPQAKFPAAAFFGVEQATIIVGSMDQICSRGSQNMGLMGVQCFPGQLESLNNAIIQWMASKVYLSHLLQTANLTRFIKSEGLQVQEAMAAKPAALQSQAKARRQAKKTAKVAARGLVASKQSKTLIIFVCLEDQAIFWPAYGHIGTRLMATDNIPLLLLFATCRPEAVSAITRSLMLQPSKLSMIDGELTRSEIWFICIYMDSTLSLCDDLLRIFAPHTTTPAHLCKN